MRPGTDPWLRRLDTILRSIERSFVDDGPTPPQPALLERSRRGAHSAPEPPPERLIEVNLASSNERGANAAWTVLTCVSGAFATLIFTTSGQELAHDSLNYYTLSLQLARNGVFAFSSEARTYGYPFLLALVEVSTASTASVVRSAVAIGQWFALIAVCTISARRTLELSGSARVGLIQYAVTACNPYLLIGATTVLTDSLASTLMYLSVVALLPTAISVPLSARTLRWTPARVRRPLPTRTLPTVAACVAGAAMLRPSALVVIVPVLVVGAVRALTGTAVDARVGALAAAIASLIVAPQIAANYRFDGRLSVTPRVLLYEQQTLWGLVNLKYATAIVPGRQPQVFYRNPLLPQTIRGRPAVASPEFPRYLLTLGIHALGQFDQDLPLAYQTEFRPWYRWPSTLLGWALVYLAGTGIWRCISHAIRQRRLNATSLAVGASVIASAAHLALYAPAATENRFAMPLFLFLGLPIALSLDALRQAFIRPAPRLVTAHVAGLAAVLAFGAAFSHWMQSLAAELR